MARIAAFEPLDPRALRHRCDPATLPFSSTADLADLEEVVGQDRAVEAVRFAIGMRREGYNLFALGPEGIGKNHVIRQFLERQAAGEPTPPDWVYVHNFGEPQRPRALRLPVGRGVELRDRMAQLVRELRAAIPAAFEADEYRNRKSALEEELKGRRETALSELGERAQREGVGLIRTPVGMGFAPLRKGEVVGREAFEALPAAEQERLRTVMRGLEEELEASVQRFARWEREGREKLRQLNREVTQRAVGHLIAELRRDFADLPDVLAYLEAVEKDIVAHAEDFIAEASGAEAGLQAALRAVALEGADFRRYQVNVLVDHRATTGAPVVYEDNPTLANVVGRTEHLAQLGALVTDFSLIKPGALHKANGGYLVLDARRVLLEPYAWEGLKRALRLGEIRIESLGQALSLVSTVSLEPEPIPLEVKVALVGDRVLYYLLCEGDPEFLELFRVQADFEERLPRTAEVELLYARLVATLARKEGLRPLDADAVARVIEYASRLAGDAERVSTHMRSLSDLLREGDHWAEQAGRTAQAAEDVQRAIDERLHRAGRLRERMGEEIQRGTILIATDGAAVGQVNGLSVLQLGETSFGWPSRITASVRLGRGEVVDIEREVELGGPIHSKGVLILAGFLGGRYAQERPLTLRASLVFEQSYGGVEGDSASLAELLALISAIAEVPVSQAVAVTGSVNQLGAVQAIGAVNDKVEGFFDACAPRGLTGQQGVIIPAANVKDLMLRLDVVEAAEAGRFHVWPVATVDQALELLTDLPAGVPAPDGSFPVESVNGRVARRLADLAEQARRYAAAGEVAPSAGEAAPAPSSGRRRRS